MRTTPSVTARPVAPPAPPAPLEIAVDLTGADRIAGFEHLYRDLIRRQHRTILWLTGALIFVAVLAQLATSWGEGGQRRPALLWTNLLDSLAGPLGAAISVLLLMGALSALSQPIARRRRWRRWLRSQGLDAPIACTYRFEADGLDTASEHVRTRFPAARLKPPVTTRSHVMIDIEGTEDTVPLPRAALTPEQMRAIEDWSAYWLATATEPEQTPPADALPQGPGDTVALAYTLTPEDRIAQMREQQKVIWPARLHWIGVGLRLLVALLVVPVTLLAVWSVDPYRVPLAYALPLLLEASFRTYWMITATLCAAVMLIALARPWFLRQQAKGLAAMADAKLPETRLAWSLTDEGLVSRQRGIVSRIDWPLIGRVERLPDQIALHLRVGQTFYLPLRALNSDQIAVFDRLVARHVAPPTTA